MKGLPLQGYAKIAIKAVEICQEYPSKDPRTAWVEACFINHKRDKGCPRGTFLSLCSLGYIKGIAAGDYSSGVRENFVYAKKIAETLDFKKTNFINYSLIWSEFQFGKPHNGHIDVFHGLYEKDMLNI
jgi:hypothetical protein